MIKLLLGGSPCTHWSIAQKNGRETKPEGLGWELFKNYLIAKERFKPDYFLYENNKSASEAIKQQISESLGTELQYINSALVSAQNRQRFYAHNIPNVEQSTDRGIVLADILDSVIDDRYCSDCQIPLNTTNDGKAQCVRATIYKDGIRNLLGNTVDRRTCVALPLNTTTDGKAYAIKAQYGKTSIKNHLSASHYPATGVALPVCVQEQAAGRKANEDGTYTRVYEARTDGKSGTLTATMRQNAVAVPSCGYGDTVYTVENGFITIKGSKYPIKLSDGKYLIRKLTVNECKKLQTVPTWYSMPCSKTQNYKMLGNGWTVEVIAHILSHIPNIANEEILVLSMYDGMSCGHIALDIIGAKVKEYYATEIDKYAIETTNANYPDTIQLGDAFQIRDNDFNIGGLLQPTKAEADNNKRGIKSGVIQRVPRGA